MHGCASYGGRSAPAMNATRNDHHSFVGVAGTLSIWMPHRAAVSGLPGGWPRRPLSLSWKGSARCGWLPALMSADYRVVPVLPPGVEAPHSHRTRPWACMTGRHPIGASRRRWAARLAGLRRAQTTPVPQTTRIPCLSPHVAVRPDAHARGLTIRLPVQCDGPWRRTRLLLRRRVA